MIGTESRAASRMIVCSPADSVSQTRLEKTRTAGVIECPVRLK